MLFFGKNKGVWVTRPTAGQIVSLEKVPDPVFAGRVLGDGFAVDPTDGCFRSPIDGELIVLAESLHAFGVRHPSGLEILVHIGVDTVRLKGEGFTTDRRMGDQVAAGDPVVTVDLEAVRPRVPSLITPVVVTSMDGFTIAELDLAAGPQDAVMCVRKRR